MPAKERGAKQFLLPRLGPSVSVVGNKQSYQPFEQNGRGGGRIQVPKCMVYVSSTCSKFMSRAFGATLYVSKLAPPAFGMLVGVLVVVLAAAIGTREPRYESAFPSAICVPATRGAHRTTVSISMGSPSTTYELLLRLDAPKNCTGDPPLVLLASTALLSKSSKCVGLACTDAAVMQHHMHGRMRNVMRPVRFLYYDAGVSDEAQELGLDGEITTCLGHEYELREQLFCQKQLSDQPSSSIRCQKDTSNPDEWTEDTVHVHGTNTRIEQLNLPTNPFWKGVPAARCYNRSGTAQVELFPVMASYSAKWMGFSKAQIYDTALDNQMLPNIRDAIEQGQTCVKGLGGAAEHHFGIFRSLCARLYTLNYMSYASYAEHCYLASYPVTESSVPYARMADRRLQISIGTDRNQCVRVTPEPSLYNVHDDASAEAPHSSRIGVVRLVLMILAACITWVRKEDDTRHIDRVFVLCAGVASYNGSERLCNMAVKQDQYIAPSPEEMATTRYDGTRGPLLSILASVARVFVASEVLLAYRPLQPLGIVEVTCGLLSLFHVFLMHVVATTPWWGGLGCTSYMGKGCYRRNPDHVYEPRCLGWSSQDIYEALVMFVLLVRYAFRCSISMPTPGKPMTRHRTLPARGLRATSDVFPTMQGPYPWGETIGPNQLNNPNDRTQDNARTSQANVSVEARAPKLLNRHLTFHEAGLRPTLGGTSAVIDASVAVLVAFVSVPLQGAGDDFVSVARALAGVFVVVGGLPRALFSLACNGVLFRRGILLVASGHRRMGVCSIAVSTAVGLFWMLQLWCVSSLLVQVVVGPLVVDFMRSYTGTGDMVMWLGVASFCLLAAPRIVANAVFVSVHAS